FTRAAREPALWRPLCHVAAASASRQRRTSAAESTFVTSVIMRTASNRYAKLRPRARPERLQGLQCGSELEAGADPVGSRRAEQRPLGRPVQRHGMGLVE